ncbi:MAG: hypothetical protein RMM29_02895 [Planctomycetota bacterium]|nr:hypothetical protein [Planctomycetota bacterium]
MQSKEASWLRLGVWGLLGAIGGLAAGEGPFVNAPLRLRDGWQELVPGLYRPPAGGGWEARLGVRMIEEDPATARLRLQEAWTTMFEALAILDDDALPLGGRVWQRLRVQYRIADLPWEQTAWIGRVGPRTLMLVLAHAADADPREGWRAEIEAVLGALPAVTP